MSPPVRTSLASALLTLCWVPLPPPLDKLLGEEDLRSSRDRHLVSLVLATLLAELTGRSELVVQGVFGAGKTVCLALVPAYLALHEVKVLYMARENTTVRSIASLLAPIFPRGDGLPAALRCVSQQGDCPLDLDLRNGEPYAYISSAKLVMCTTGLIQSVLGGMCINHQAIQADS